MGGQGRKVKNAAVSKQGRAAVPWKHCHEVCHVVVRLRRVFTGLSITGGMIFNYRFLASRVKANTRLDIAYRNLKKCLMNLRDETSQGYDSHVQSLAKFVFGKVNHLRPLQVIVSILFCRISSKPLLPGIEHCWLRFLSLDYLLMLARLHHLIAIQKLRRRVIAWQWFSPHISKHGWAPLTLRARYCGIQGRSNWLRWQSIES